VLSLVAEPTVLRLGALDTQTLADALGRPVHHAARNPTHPRASKQWLDLALAVRVVPEGQANASEVVLARRPAPMGATQWHTLPDTPGPWVAAFYQALRDLERRGVRAVCVEALPDDVRWAAAAQRLSRAAGH
jgi:hypothetical protein